MANRTERHSTKRKRRAPLALLIVPVVLVALGAALVFVLSGGEVGGIIGEDDDADDVPELEFKVSKVFVESTVTGEVDEVALEEDAQLVAAEIVPVIDDLFTNGFLDPANWREGDYEEIFESFSDAAAGPARQAVETLTLGVGAGDVYERVTPVKGGLIFTVGFDPEGAPHTVFVRIRFFGLGERKDGDSISIFSGGQMTLQDLDGWRIVAFDMRRNDKVTAPPSPAPSGSVSGAGPGGTAATGTTGTP